METGRRYPERDGGLVVKDLPEPDFIDRDPQTITNELIALYEEKTGKTLYPGQVDRIWVDIIAYRETLLRIRIQEAAKQNLVRYASGVMLNCWENWST